VELRDIAGDPGLEPTQHASARGPYVGTPAARPIRRFARPPRLDRLLRELYAGFGPQRWWPARTPFEVIVGAVLTQNTSWRNVERALASLAAATALTPARLLDLPEPALAAAIRSSGYFNAKARTLREVSRWYLEVGGLATLRTALLPSLRAGLLGVRGVGPETADSILCYAAGRRVAVIDAYTRRLLARHGFTSLDAPYEFLRGYLEEHLVDAQVVYEEFHALAVRVGYEHCKPTPRCASCPATTPVDLAERSSGQ
jgi:endonuclease-3 related protein